MAKTFRKRVKTLIKKLSKRFSSSFPKPKKEESEFGKRKKGILICSNCGALYFKGHWKHASEVDNVNNLKVFNHILCPACDMIKNHKFEGEVLIENIRPEIKKELINSIKNVGKIAYQRDPEDRIISIKNKDNLLEILTTENQLAVRIGKKLKKTFNGDLKITHSKKESTSRAYLKL